jgi:hypothetical protein
MMSSTSINKKQNPAKFYSIAALVSLCIGITVFLKWFSNNKISNKKHQKTLNIFGLLSMSFTCLLFTPWHNELILFALISGIIPIAIIINVILNDINNYDVRSTIFTFTFLIAYVLIYYLNLYKTVHPIVQKCAVVFGILWIIRVIFKGRG